MFSIKDENHRFFPFFFFPFVYFIQTQNYLCKPKNNDKIKQLATFARIVWFFFLFLILIIIWLCDIYSLCSQTICMSMMFLIFGPLCYIIDVDVVVAWKWFELSIFLEQNKIDRRVRTHNGHTNRKEPFRYVNQTKHWLLPWPCRQCSFPASSLLNHIFILIPLARIS